MRPAARPSSDVGSRPCSWRISSLVRETISGLDVLPAVGAVVAMKAPGVLTVGGVCPPSLHLRGYALPECRVIPQRAHVLRRSGLLP